jgi:hypothetical protein
LPHEARLRYSHYVAELWYHVAGRVLSHVSLLKYSHVGCDICLMQLSSGMVLAHVNGLLYPPHVAGLKYSYSPHVAGLRYLPHVSGLQCSPHVAVLW